MTKKDTEFTERETSVIRKIHEGELAKSLQIIRESFITVANELALTEANSPTNPAFLTIEKLTEAYEKGIQMFGLFTLSGQQVGFVAVEQAKDNIYYMERLAVLPEERHSGYGKQLMDFVFQYIKEKSGIKVSIGIINENARLKKWYQNYGFVETGIRKFDHLPFTVCFLEKNV